MSPFHAFILALLCLALTRCDARDNRHRHGHRHHRPHAHGKRTSTLPGGLGVFDLTHPLAMDTMPVAESGSPLEMSLETHDDGMGARSEYYEFCMDEKLGTHLNAPSMYQHREGTMTAEALPLSMLVRAQAVIVDLPDAKIHRSSLLTRDHLDSWENQHGRIPPGSYVILRTGWADYFEQPDKFLGNFADESKQVFPGFSGDAVEWLIGERDIAGLGTECIDVELGWKTRNAVKLQLAAANRVSLVQLANLAQLPPAGIEVTVAPLKLGGGSGGPARVFAVSGVRGGGGDGRNDGQRHGSHRYDDINDLRGEDLKMTQNDARPSERTLRSSSSSKSGGGSVHGDVRTILVAAAAMVLALLVAHAQ